MKWTLKLAAILWILIVSFGCDSGGSSVQDDGTQTQDQPQDQPSDDPSGDEPSDTPTPTTPASMTSCGTGALLSVSPIDLTNLNPEEKIFPLGNVSPSEHTFPTQHLYWKTKNRGTNEGVFSLYAPADATVTKISYFENLTTHETDYSLFFSPCSEFQGYFRHITTLSSALSAALNTDNCRTYNPGDGDYRLCDVTTSVEVSAGDVLGTIGGSNGSFDFGAYDARITAHAFANADRYHSETNKFDSFHVVCAIDYFESTVKTQIEAQLNHTGEGTACGVYMQDVVGTAKGNWFVTGTTGAPESQSGHLSLVSDNLDGDLRNISSGNQTLGVGAFAFTPQSSGRVNRDFSGITSDGFVYCFDSLEEAPTSIFILQMTSSSSLQIERQTADSCGSGPWSFTSSAVSFVR